MQLSTQMIQSIVDKINKEGKLIRDIIKEDEFQGIRLQDVVREIRKRDDAQEIFANIRALRPNRDIGQVSNNGDGTRISRLAKRLTNILVNETEEPSVEVKEALQTLDAAITSFILPNVEDEEV